MPARSAAAAGAWRILPCSVTAAAGDGMALAYPGGWGFHAWHGRRVPAWVIEQPAIERIAAESNTEIRRCAIESLGWDRFTGQAGRSPGAGPCRGRRTIVNNNHLSIYLNDHSCTSTAIPGHPAPGARHADQTTMD
jgi:hypothetical protein